MEQSIQKYNISDRQNAPSFLPSSVILEITYQCNHSCIFCSCPWENVTGQFKCKPELTTAEWKNLITALCHMGVVNIALSGGEPLERSDIAEIISHAATCTVEHIHVEDDVFVSRLAPPNIHLLSNGRRVDASVLEMCKTFGVQLSMSLPGLETFEIHTGFDGAAGVLQNFEKARSVGLRPIANISVTKLNLHELDKTIAAALLAGAEQILLNRFLPGGRGIANAQQLSLSSDELLEMLSVTDTILKAADRFGSLGTEIPKCLVDPSGYTNLNVTTRCAAGIDFFVVGPSGFVRVCNHSPIELNHISDIDNLKTNEYWKTFTQKRYLPTECGNCDERHGCDGGCREAAHIVGGKVNALDVLLMSRPAEFFP